jgi:inhibitor of cysteine peptidase
MKRPLLCILGLVASLSIGCHDGPAGSVTVTQAQNGDTVSLATGDILVVELAGNPTTGYEWAVVQNDASLLQPREPAYEPDSSAIGSGGVYTFRFTALESGSTLLKLAYRRAWEPAPIDTFSLTVNIQSAGKDAGGLRAPISER